MKTLAIVLWAALSTGQASAASDATCVKLAQEVSLGEFGGAELFFVDLDHDGRPEVLAYQGTGRVRCTVVFRPAASEAGDAEVDLPDRAAAGRHSLVDLGHPEPHGPALTPAMPTSRAWLRATSMAMDAWKSRWPTDGKSTFSMA